MDLSDAVRARRMVRSYTDQPVDPALVDHLCDLARRAPSAGKAQALDLVVLEGAEQVARYWDTTLPAERRAGFRWPGLVAAPVLIVVAVRAGAYVERYAEGDKAATGLGAGEAAWPVPYWWVDAGAAVEHLLLGATEAGLGACLFGLFDHEAAVAEALGIPDVPSGRRLVATVSLGHPRPADPGADPAADPGPGRSAGRPRRDLRDVVHRGGW